MTKMTKMSLSSPDKKHCPVYSQLLFKCFLHHCITSTTNSCGMPVSVISINVQSVHLNNVTFVINTQFFPASQIKHWSQDKFLQNRLVYQKGETFGPTLNLQDWPSEVGDRREGCIVWKTGGPLLSLSTWPWFIASPLAVISLWAGLA